MQNRLVYAAGSTSAIRYASAYLLAKGIPIVTHPTPEVTHLLLDVPSFQPDGMLKGNRELVPLLEMLPDSICVIGGNLAHPALENYPVMDLLTDSFYTAKNAAITAECALQIAANRLDCVYADLPVLVIGWGRIGKCLGKMLQDRNAKLTILARKEADRAILSALGYPCISPDELSVHLPEYRLIFNTAPEPVISAELGQKCRSCLKIDLASRSGILCEDTVAAKGLPGICAPESSGKLIAETIIRILKEDAE